MRADEPIVGKHPIVRALRAAIDGLAHIPVAVAISGEPGTGKDLVARALHRRAGADELVRLTCSDAPEELERRLARHASELAHRRLTLLLDELPALPLDLQGQLSARLAQTERRQGRVVVTLQGALTTAQRSGLVSGALLRQLAPVELAIPPLRERRADIPVLVEHFLARYGAQHAPAPCRIETEALVCLWEHDWSGNVRELENVLERAVVLCRGGVIRTSDLPPPMNGLRRDRRLSAPAATRPEPPILRPQL